jgi:hypothetical protein
LVVDTTAEAAVLRKKKMGTNSGGKVIIKNLLHFNYSGLLVVDTTAEAAVLRKK